MGAKRPENFLYYKGSLHGFQYWIWNPGTQDFFPVPWFWNPDTQNFFPVPVFWNPGTQDFFSSTGIWNPGTQDFHVWLLPIRTPVKQIVTKKWLNSAVKKILKSRYPGFSRMAPLPKDTGKGFRTQKPAVLGGGGVCCTISSPKKKSPFFFGSGVQKTSR